MKKLLVLLLAFVMLFSLTACGGGANDVDDDRENNKEDSSWGTTGTTTVTTTTTKRTTTTTKMPTTTTVPKQEDWIVNYYVDEFDQPTSEWYITNKQWITGKFSNSATTDSRLTVRLLIDAENFGFVLYEYGSHQVKNSYSRSKTYAIKMRDANGGNYSLQGVIGSGGDRIVLRDNNRKTVLAALKKTGSVMFYIENNDYTTTTYLFTVETSNLGELLDQKGIK